MSWRDLLHAASFRGVPFKIDSSDGQGGRRLAIHEFPGRDKPYVEDMGRRHRAFTIQAIVIGRDYMTGRDALISALEKSGAGTLVHPYYGRISVDAGSYTVHESTREGGMARITIQFVESGKQAMPAGAPDTATAVSNAASTADTASQSEFASRFSVSGFPGWVATKATSVLTTATNKINALQKSMPAIPQYASQAEQQFTTTINSLDKLITSPVDLSYSIAGMIRNIGVMAQQPLNAFSTYQGLVGYNDFGSVPKTTPSRLQQAANLLAVVLLLQQQAAIGQALASTQMTFSGSADALATRDALAATLDTQAAQATTDASYNALTDLRVAVINDLTTRAAALPQIGSYTPKAVLPALVLAQRLFSDGSQADALLARNNIMNPGFVPAASPLEYLL